MIDLDRTYSQQEVDDLEGLGYEFESVQTMSDRDPVYIVARYNPPRNSGGCRKTLAPDQWWSFCGETDMGQTLPALCTECGGEYRLMPK